MEHCYHRVRTFNGNRCPEVLSFNSHLYSLKTTPQSEWRHSQRYIRRPVIRVPSMHASAASRAHTCVAPQTALNAPTARPDHPHICVNTSFCGPIPIITKGNIMGNGNGFVIVVFVIINYNWIHQLINLYSLKTTPQSEYCKDPRRKIWYQKVQKIVKNSDTRIIFTFEPEKNPYS